MKRSSKMNLIFTALLLAAAALLFWLNSGKPAGRTALLTYGTSFPPEQTLEIPLDRDARYDIESGEYTIHLLVQDGCIRFVDSPCPDHICENTGWLCQAGDTAACMPALASVVVLGE